jgi:hypothetical protein
MAETSRPAGTPTPEAPEHPPLDQIEARRAARDRTEVTRRIHIAVPVPLGCWGGHETGWTVLDTHVPREATTAP